MHDYLRAVGFSKLADRKSLKQLLKLVMARPDQEYYAGGRDCPLYWEKSKDFLPGAGLTVRGDADESGMLTEEYFFPHFHGNHVSFTGDVELEKLFERDEYNGVCELPDMSVVIVFHMNRLRDYAEQIKKSAFIENAPVRLSALSIKGSVLLPMARSQAGKADREREAVASLRYEAANSDDPEAAAKLAMLELDIYNMIMHRLYKKEDVLSIVETSFIPFGTTSDQYMVLGDILETKEAYNQLSGEKLWQLTVLCNRRLIDLCINAEDLMGEPKKGRRFRGIIWLQGQL